MDNPNIGREMIEVWKLGSLKKFGEFIKLATGEDISPEAFLEEVNMNIDSCLSQAKERIQKLAFIPEHTGPIQLNAVIRMVNGKEVIADNSKSFEDMAEKYAAWLHNAL